MGWPKGKSREPRPPQPHANQEARRPDPISEIARLMDMVADHVGVALTMGHKHLELDEMISRPLREHAEDKAGRFGQMKLVS